MQSDSVGYVLVNYRYSVQAECGNLSGNELTLNSSGNTQSQTSQLSEPLWTDPCVKRRISLYELISTLKNKPCLLYTSPSPRDCIVSRMPSSA